MAHFAALSGGTKGIEYINLDLIRHVIEATDGTVTVIFDSGHQMTLGESDSKMILEEINKTIGSAF